MSRAQRGARKVVVIGAGIGGLAAAASLARRGLDVTVLEAHIYPGGCAGTFFHQGYRFDAGATLAGGFYPGGPMELLAQEAGITAWPVEPLPTAMRVHLPGGEVADLVGDEQRWEARRRLFGPGSLDFWRWQESAADALWALALRLPAWPPQTAGDAAGLARAGLGWLSSTCTQPLSLAAAALQPLYRRLPSQNALLRTFIDAQLLISAQATAQSANALYAAAALDLPRRGPAGVCGGIGALAQALVLAVRWHGGRVEFRQRAARITGLPAAVSGVETEKGAWFPADTVIANLTSPDLRRLLPEPAHSHRKLQQAPPADGWGAFMLYLGVKEETIPAGSPLHHQVIAREPLGEGSSIFLSISPAWDPGRAPAGRRAVTVSTHTRPGRWFELRERDAAAYESEKLAMQQVMLRHAARVFPGIDTPEFILPGSPLSFTRFTGRSGGWVGGYPQTSLLRSQPPRLGQGLWQVGDSIFPGQSIPAAALGGLRVARMVLAG